MKGNFVEVGTVVGIDLANRALVRVQLFDRVSAWIPYQSISNKFMKVWIPPQLNEQVIVVLPFAEANGGIALGSIFNKGCKEPEGANDHTAIVEFSDGTRIVYDTQTHDLSITTEHHINLSATAVNITGDLNVTGTITDEKGSLSTHVHTGVASGNAQSGVRP
ncbi:phage baseplate assembly protein V [Sulfurospirillum cavolei]|uniref:phage baseplate assembly protein V n=1 Tax=Sulfurospirillum cavolei TaxID=366522 RepID=UPI000764981E|nr:phage baseplate assembly protein V [Sulfurospirillum cavolei]